VTASPSARWYGPAQSLQVSSGTGVLPERVEICTAPGAAWIARQVSVPHAATVPASFASEWNCPSAARPASTRTTCAGFDVAKYRTAPAPSMAVICWASNRVSSIARQGSPARR
jgi:hypothetical protein